MSDSLNAAEIEKLNRSGEIEFQLHIPAKDPVYTPIPPFISDQLISRIAQKNIRFLYQHQTRALEAIASQSNVILSTGTSSGKSLCYQIPIMEMVENDPAAAALLVFPTKALTIDQYKSLCSMMPDAAGEIAVYDGDTKTHQRPTVRQNARVILTNPDMLHLSILPFHPAWARIFENLKYIVIDEAHIYKGVFGAHTANVIRRLLRIVQHYAPGKRLPQFILCSATLSNAKQFAERLIGSEVQEIFEDTSGNGSRDIYFVNPQIIDEELHVRAGSIYTAAKIAEVFEHRRDQTLIYCQSRQSVETAVRRLREVGIDAQGYRSGYLPAERRTIESGLKQGQIQTVVSTNALELGMDISGMDAILTIGYPGSIASFYQRMGRAGRNLRPSSFVMIASQNPTDQYLMSHLDYIIERKSEPVLIDPDNLQILLQHLQCALAELPFKTTDTYGGLDQNSTQQLLNYLCECGIAKLSNEQFFWIDANVPQRSVSLRNSSLDRITIEVEEKDGKLKTIGIIDRSSSYWMIHEGAIYFHNGESYRIESLNLAENFALAYRIETEYTTEADKKTSLQTEKHLLERSIANADLTASQVLVTNQVVSYKKRHIETVQILGIYPLDLPEETLSTNAFIICLKPEFIETLKSENKWKNDPNQYGSDWQELRRQALERDGFHCKLCGAAGTGVSLHVHHLVPFRNFTDADEANNLDNLVSLCAGCHERVESAVRMRSGLAGFGTAFQQMAALFLECDIGDISAVSDPACAEFGGKPTVYIYETIPAGIGLSQSIFDNFEKIASAVESLIEDCSCEDGCPGCVGAAGEIGSGGKAEALAIATGLLEEPI